VPVAGGLAAGIWLARTQRGPAGDGGSSVALDISERDGRATLDGVTVDVHVEPRPARAFEELNLRLRFEPDDVTEARLSFNMMMDMGPHDYNLVRQGGDWWARGVVLPKCVSGSRLWFANLELRDGTGATKTGRFRFELAPDS
jgi:hypothetical protein